MAVGPLFRMVLDLQKKEFPKEFGFEIGDKNAAERIAKILMNSVEPYNKLKYEKGSEGLNNL